jgi:hypothetical protein
LIRTCAWCAGPIPEGARRDAVTCRKACRQARHRAAGHASRNTTVRAVAPAGGRDTSRPRRLAYADPPYPGNARLYRGHPDYAGEVDHAALLSRMATNYDGWALSTSARALPQVLALAVAQGLPVRVAAWVRQPRPHATARYPLNAWEPVIYVPVTQHRGAGVARRIDVLQHGVMPLTTLPSRVIGAKPPAFCAWLFDLIGAEPGDEFDDLFPGSGVVAKVWELRAGV